MTTNESNSPPEPQSYDPFSYPRLYPSGWNLENSSGDQANLEEAVDTESEPNPNALPSWYEPFRDLRTFPSGWDLP